MILIFCHRALDKAGRASVRWRDCVCAFGSWEGGFWKERTPGVAFFFLSLDGMSESESERGREVRKEGEEGKERKRGRIANEGREKSDGREGQSQLRRREERREKSTTET